MNSCPEIELYEEIKPDCLFGHFRYAFQKMVQDFKVYYPEAEKLTFSDGLAQMMKANDWWDSKILEYLL